MKRRIPSRRVARNSLAGFSLLELIMACAILLVLATAALPLTRMTVQRQREAELRRDLREMRSAIDRYKDDADKNLIRTEVGSQNYPPDLQTLVDGVTVSVGGGGVGGISASALATASGTSQFGAVGTSPVGQGATSGTSALGSAANQAGSALSTTPTKVRYLRKIPIDPMTGKADWGMRAVGDDPDSDSWGGSNVFDVHSQSTATAIDGSNYKDW